MDFKQLQTYVAVVECESFSKAAQQLFISQPTVSAHIRMLEDELGSSLIERTTKSIMVTSKGRAVYEYAVGILKIRERMIQICAEEQKRIIRIAASTIPSAYMLPQILPEYGRMCMQTYFSIQQVKSKEVLSGVEDGQYDIGFSALPGDGDLMSIPICQDRMVLITPVSQDFLEIRAKECVSTEELFQRPIILREKMDAGQKMADLYLTELGVREQDLHVVARANDQETVKQLVAGGMGISLISHRAAQNFIAEKRVLCFELPLRSEKTIYLVCRKSNWQTEYIQKFAAFVKRKYEQE